MIQPIRPQDASGIYQRQVEQAPEAAPARPGNRRSGGTSAAPRHDQVTVSPRAHLLRRVMETMPEISDVRTSRVEELQARVEAGDYEVDAQSIARRLLDDGLAL